MSDTLSKWKNIFQTAIKKLPLENDDWPELVALLEELEERRALMKPEEGHDEWCEENACWCAARAKREQEKRETQ